MQGTGSRLNCWLDSLPRTTIWRGAVEGPAYRTCGVVGCHLALAVSAAAALRAGLSLAILVWLGLACGLSFLLWAHLRRRLHRLEDLVLMEHQWLALLLSALTLRSLHQPVLAYLDVVCLGMCVLSALGRVGCLLVGCCHGLPSSIGIRYDASIADCGFDRHLVGVRLFPAPAAESLGWVAIGAIGWFASPQASPGWVTAWVLVAYAILRFGLEALRGDPRPVLLGLSQGRWMASAQAAIAILIGERVRGADAFGVLPLVSAGALLGSVALAALWLSWKDPRRRLLSRSHVSELRDLIATLARRSGPDPEVARSGLGVAVGVSRAPEEGGRAIRASIGLPAGLHDLRLLCEVVAAALPELRPDRALLSPRTLLHVELPAIFPDPLLPAPPPRAVADALHGAVLRQLQGEPATGEVPPLDPSPPTPAPGGATGFDFGRMKVSRS